MTTERKSERSGIKIGDKDYTLLAAKAIKTFWNTKKKQLIVMVMYQMTFPFILFLLPLLAI